MGMRFAWRLLVLIVAFPVLAQAPDADMARQRILGSLATACRQFSGDDQWRQLDACNAAWFRAHEEEVWRLNVNPHAPHASGPSS